MASLLRIAGRTLANKAKAFLVDDEGRLEVKAQLKGSIPTLGGLSTDPKPTLATEDRAFYYEQDTGELYYWDGSDWVVS